MSVPWRDKAGVIHAWLWSSAWDDRNESHHAGWHTARAPCGASRRLRRGRDADDRPRGADVNCMNCLVLEGSESNP